MADCYLTERQKALLRSLVPGLKDGTIQASWFRFFLRGEGTKIKPTLPEQVQEIWQSSTQADFDDFVDCGFLRKKGDKAYTLYIQKIINTVENDFHESNMPYFRQDQLKSIMVTPIFGLPSKSQQLLCDAFMMMPFDDKFRSIYDNHIKSVFDELGLNIIRGDDPFTGHEILSDIWSAIYNSRFIIIVRVKILTFSMNSASPMR